MSHQYVIVPSSADPNPKITSTDQSLDPNDINEKVNRNFEQWNKEHPENKINFTFPPPERFETTQPVPQYVDHGWNLDSDRRNDGGELGNRSKSTLDFSETSVRLGFIRKVYAILSVQLLVTLGFVALFLFQEDVQKWNMANPALMIAAMVTTIVLCLVLACVERARRQTPWNFIILGIFTLCEAWLMGTIAGCYDVWEVMLAVGIVAAITVALTIFALQSKHDFTAWGGALLVVMVVLLLFGIMAAILRNNYLNIFYSCLGALLFGLYLVFDTQMMLGGHHKYALSPEEYIFAALNLYLDILNLFMHILAIIGQAKK